jgi:hypothetical protein
MMQIPCLWPAMAMDEVNHTLYCFGGRIHSAININQIQCYNILTRQWSTICCRLRHSRYKAASVYIPKWHGFIICGGIPGSFDGHLLVEFYSIERNICIDISIAFNFKPLSFAQNSIQSIQSIHYNNDKLFLIKNSDNNNSTCLMKECPVFIADISKYSTINDLIIYNAYYIYRPPQWQQLPSLPNIGDQDFYHFQAITVFSSL